LASYHTDDFLYNALRTAGSPFRFRPKGLENVSQEGAAIFVANHLGSLGPIQVILTLPFRFYPWVIAENLDLQRAPRYLHDDFVRPTLHLNGHAGAGVSFAIAQIAVRMLAGMGSVPVERNKGFPWEAFRRSRLLLQQGKRLLIFPEDPTGPLDLQTGMRSFLCGFFALCRVYEQDTGARLPVYPVIVHPESRTVHVDQPLYYQHTGQRREDIRRACEQLEARMKGLYIALNQTIWG